MEINVLKRYIAASILIPAITIAGVTVLTDKSPISNLSDGTKIYLYSLKRIPTKADKLKSINEVVKRKICNTTPLLKKMNSAKGSLFIFKGGNGIIIINILKKDCNNSILDNNITTEELEKAIQKEESKGI